VKKSRRIAPAFFGAMKQSGRLALAHRAQASETDARQGKDNETDEHGGAGRVQ